MIWVIVGVLVLLLALSILAWFGITFWLKSSKQTAQKSAVDVNKDFKAMGDQDVEHLFNNEFRQELRNSGRLHFENLINQNAALLNQGLNEAINQLNKYAKDDVNNQLTKELAAYVKSMQDAESVVKASLQKNLTIIDQQQQAVMAAMNQQLTAREEALIKAYETNMAKIIEHYLLEALGQQFDLKTQLPMIISQMEANKQAMIEDMRL